MKGIRFLLLVAGLFLINTLTAQKITIAAASDLRYALNEIRDEFKKSYPGITIDIIYGASGNLYQQIVNQAPFDVFFSADLTYAEKLDSLNLAGSKPKLYATGHLVLWSASRDVSGGIESLKNSDVNKIAIANPAVAPYGLRAIECLKYYKLYDEVKEKLVQGENVSQAAQFVLTGNAEIGIIALSLALSPGMMNRGKFTLIAEISYSELKQAYVIMKHPETPDAVLKFTRFLEKEQAKKIFEKYGFKLPAE